MTLRFGLTYIQSFFALPQWHRRPGAYGPHRIGDGLIRAYWIGPVAVLVLTDRRS